MKTRGKVIWFRKNFGYGFIKVEGEAHPNAFLHYTNLNMVGYKNIKKNTIVEFDLQYSRIGPVALDVSVIDGS